MKIMHLISSIGIFGAEKVLLDLAEEQKRAGDEAWVVALKNLYNPHDEVVREAEKRGLLLFSVESRHRLDLGSVKTLAEIIQVNGIELIHTHNVKADILGVLAGAKTHTPVVATNHLWTQADAKLRFYEKIDAFVLRHFVKKIVAVSGSIRDDMIRARISAQKIIVILNGIRAREPKTAPETIRQRFGVAHDAILIGTIARLSPEKGHRFLFEAAKEILHEESRATFLILGDGPSRKELESLVVCWGLKEKVIFAGFQTGMDDIYGALDIVVQPSLREGTPLAILEAMNFGKAIIATRVGGVSDVLTDNETGILIPPASVEALSESILRLLKDYSLRTRLAERAREVARQEFSIEKMASGYRKIYERVLNG